MNLNNPFHGYSMATCLNLNGVPMGQEKTTDKKQCSLMVKIL